LKAINTGHLRDSILVEMTDNKLAAEIGPTVDYGAYVEFGTQPHFPPLAALEDWARKHGIPAFLVARAIARRGTFARPYLAPAFDVVIGYFEADLAAIYEKSEL
jgi:phage gpG-like protein